MWIAFYNSEYFGVYSGNQRYPSLESEKNSIISAYLLLEECYVNGGKLLVAGNGGSAADAEHRRSGYEILTYLFDSYYVLPERPDLAALFCWQAINHSYYVQQLSDNNVGFCQDTKGIELITHSFGTKLKALMLGEEVEITFCDVQGTKKTYKFTEVERMSFVLFGILYASRCNNFHGNVAARMNSINANKDTFKMYTDMFLTEYIILAIHLNSQGALSDVVLNKVKKNANLMI